jgi:hypothetical protein
MASDLRPAKDIIKALPVGIQERTIQQLNTDLSQEQELAAEAEIDKAVQDIRLATPEMTIDDASQLQEWYDRRKTGRPGGN